MIVVAYDALLEWSQFGEVAIEIQSMHPRFIHPRPSIEMPKPDK
jgi:hypothetical protein